jgi:triosephosphate isomerase
MQTPTPLWPCATLGTSAAKEAFTLRRPLIAGNWKMYKTSIEAVEFARQFTPLVDGLNDRDIMIAPAFTALEATATALKGTPVALGAQDLFWETEGAYTGQVSPRMLVSCGCRYVIIGHSERRQYFGETDESVHRKIQAALQAGLIPVMCVGETEKEREAGQTFSILDKQVKNGLKNFVAAELGSLVIAYEPVWAIGTGKTATADQAQEVHQFIRSLITRILGAELATALRILYGGSVKPDNISELMAMADIDGALVGGASLKPDSFSRIVKFN